MTGLFITIEGPDGAGKSGLIKRLVPAIQSMINHPLVVTREPGGSVIAEEIRKLILDPKHLTMDARTEALLYAASRRQHVVEKILPALSRGEVVLCDRFVDSSIAYQGQARGIGMEKVMAINEFAIEGLKPDITLYLDVDVEVGLKRIKDKKSKRTQDRLELEAVTFHEEVSKAYHLLIEKDPSRFRIIDASLDQDSVFQNALDALITVIEEYDSHNSN
ncbi:dTMP kinase [Marinilactibacillus psychrotolerans]|uniref:Thymidylate kinase n=2 Tax=Marinilactibacillus psychrotolerans TaxID=191770 RepID=A0A511H2A0_9LACT|nr:dTMP kinase [Marinilactibacillus psychrotolerans]TLQ06319.1 dTMP kinase [Marinilactibacillus psychrotolerans]SDD13926.1 dTMP kinase [Marinilactibacillus psychrotolerans]SJN45739.1 Thymidylate kinase [Marinilactibacillus psychrotolerans 42ea]GEL67658.1 thymidylate kinase [Marinilactibacillus psychrotolerans]GEQ33572.1 thymidylate kinase [Marinilactibacillus psychrotolerans]